MTPYKITSATLTTYSGRRHTIDVESEYMTESVRKVKERMLDWFTSKIKSSDPFVKIELRTKEMFSHENKNKAQWDRIDSKV